MGGLRERRAVGDPVTNEEICIFGGLMLALLACFGCVFLCIRRCHYRQFARWRASWEAERAQEIAWAREGSLDAAGRLQHRFPPTELRSFSPVYLYDRNNAEKLYRVV